MSRKGGWYDEADDYYDEYEEEEDEEEDWDDGFGACLLYTSPSPRDLSTSRMPSSA